MLSKFIKYLDVKYSPQLFVLILIIGYGVFAGMAFFQTKNQSYVEVAFQASLSCFIIIIFSRIRIIPKKYSFRKIELNADILIFFIFITFYIFAVILLVTADSIPLVSWFAGVDSETLAEQREGFLKAREGWQSIFPYINAIFTGAMIPYCLAYIFIKKYKWRWLIFGSFLVYCLVFIEKVFFLKAMLPLMYVIYCVRRGSVFSLLMFLSVCASIVFALGVVSGFGVDAITSGDQYFSNDFRPAGTLQFLLWRAVAVPLFTAADSISYFFQNFNSNFMLGASSGLLSSFFGLERVYFERLVFGYQWGQTATGTGSANAVFFIDAYVNFGYTGIIVISALIGLLFGYMKRSCDQALHAIWPLFAFGLYVSGFVGNLASNGFLAVFLLSACIQLHSRTDGAIKINKEM